jgi:hypothetical protein
MNCEIKIREQDEGPGYEVHVQLTELTDAQFLLIYQNNMLADNVLVCRHESAPSDPFNKFFCIDTDHYTVWDKPSRHHAILFADQVYNGIQTLNTQFFALNQRAFEPHPRKPTYFDLSLIPQGLWTEHCAILGEPGGGKTQLVQTLILQLSKAANPPSFVVIDSQNKMLPLLKQKFSDAIHVDPAAPNAPTLNVFHVPDNLSDFAKTLDSFRFMFEAGDEPLTGSMRMVFNKAVALMLIGYPPAKGLPASIEDFEQFFAATSTKGKRSLSKSARAAVMHMPEAQRAWYLNDYPQFDIQCKSIAQRLENLCGEYQPFRRLLSNNSVPLNFRNQIDGGGKVLINTNRDYLGEHASVFMGRFFINHLLQQMRHRDLDSRPLFFIIDEVHQYFDDNILELINETRKRNISCIFSFQRTSQLKSPTLRDAMSNVAILMGTNFGRNNLAEAMDLFNATSMDFIREQTRDRPTHPRSAKYALLHRFIERPISFELPFYQLEKLPAPSAPNPQPAPKQQSADPRPDPPGDSPAATKW